MQCSARRLILVSAVLVSAALQIPSAEARGYPSRYTNGRQRYMSYGPPPELDSDAELLRALEFLEKYESLRGTTEAQNRGRTREMPPLYAGPSSRSRDIEPYPMQRRNYISPSLDRDYGIRIPFRPMTVPVDVDVVAEFDDDDDDDDLALEDLVPPRPEDLETNELVFAQAIADEFREDEGRKQKELFGKILGDVMAERLLQEDEEEKIEELMEVQEEEEQGLEDLAAILESDSSMSSSIPQEAIGPYDSEDLQMSMFSASSQPGDEIFTGASSSSAEEDVAEDDDESFALSEAGLEALDEAEKILTEGYGDDEEDGEESASSDSMPDFDDTLDISGLLQGAGQLESSESEEPSEEAKENVLKDVIYRIVESNLRRKMEASAGSTEQYPEENSMASSENDPLPDKIDQEHLLDSLVDEIRSQVDELSSKIMRRIKGKEAEDESDSDSSESSASREDSVAQVATFDGASASSSDGAYNDGAPYAADESSSIPDNVVGMEGIGSSSSMAAGEFDAELSSSSSVGEDGLAEKNEELLNAIREILPAAQRKVCPVLSYLVDDCSVIEGFKGLGSGGYREAFSRPCNRHQLCYICSNSYSIPPNLCDEIYKAELLTLCNGDPECKQRAKYFWIAATNDRRPPSLPLSFCSDRCLLDYLLEE